MGGRLAEEVCHHSKTNFVFPCFHVDFIYFPYVKSTYIFKIALFMFLSSIQIVSVIERHPDVQKISFLCHSLGGLIARYAIAKLYEQDERKEDVKVNGECSNHGWSRDQSRKEEFKGKIAGLEPVNFITCATPHLGSRGHKQVNKSMFFFYLFLFNLHKWRFCIFVTMWHCDEKFKGIICIVSRNALWPNIGYLTIYSYLLYACELPCFIKQPSN